MGASSKMALACCLGWMLSSLPAAAQSSRGKNGTTDKAAAQALFDEGVRLADMGLFEEACPKFEASQDLDSGIGTLLFLGDCYEQTGRRASAWAAFREAESLARASRQYARALLASTRAAALNKKLSHVTISVPVHARVEGLQVRVGDRDVPQASFDQALPIDAGEQIIEASAPGHQPFRRSVTVSDDRPHEYRVTVPVLLPAPTPDDGSTLRTLGVVTGAVGIAAVGTGAVFGLMAAEKTADSVRYCPEEPEECAEQAVELQEDAESYTDVAKGSLLAGGGLILTGIVLYVAAPSAREKEKTAVRTVKLAPLLGSSWGASVNGSF